MQVNISKQKLANLNNSSVRLTQNLRFLKKGTKGNVTG